MHQSRFTADHIEVTHSHPVATTPELEVAHAEVVVDRLQRVLDQLHVEQVDAVLLHDPVNIRYATDTSNMQVWTMHNAGRYALVLASGHVVMWEFHGCEHLAEGKPQVSEVRSAVGWSYFGAGSRRDERASIWAAEIDSLLREHIGGGASLAIDRNLYEAGVLLSAHGHNLVEGEGLMERAREIKSPAELQLMQHTIDVCEQGIQRMYHEMRPGMTENELWAYLHFENIQSGGEWIETRLLNSGPRTNPWMQESSNRVIQEGELLSFDTDLIGPFGYCADISRSWTVGHVAPTAQQRKLYQQAHEQLHVNQGMLKAGLSFKEFSDAAWQIPEQYYANRYCCIAHGVGMADEYPAIAHAGDDWQKSGYDGVFEANMVVSVESYIGEEGGNDGVKLEQQVLITENGSEALSSFPFEEHWL